jgi:predicted MFS family arabinose efflux permease
VVGGLYAARSARTGVARLTWAALGYAAAVGLVAAAPVMWAAVAACVLVGAASVTFLTTGNATIQLASEPDYRGRVTALWSMAFNGSTPIGAPIIGALSDAAGPRYALALGAAACLGAVFVGRAGTHGPSRRRYSKRGGYAAGGGSHRVLARAAGWPMGPVLRDLRRAG